MDFSQLSELDFNNAGDWPLPVKLGAVALLIVLVIGLLYYFDTQHQITLLTQVSDKELELRKTFTDKNNKASQLEAYKQQLAEMKESFGSMLKQLPDKTEVASLLVEVTQTGLATGLEFELFRPGVEVPEDFYAKLPITIKVIGNYHNFGNFVSGLAALPRIVTIENVTLTPKDIGPKSETPKGQLLVMDAIAKTYRYLEGEGGK